jgi:hypothetical protein
MSKAMLRDTTIWRWYFFRRGNSAGQGDRAEDHETSFAKALGVVSRWAGQEVPFGKISFARHERTSSVGLYSSGWNEVGGLKKCIEARAMLDVCYIQSGCAEENVSNGDVIPRLAQAEQALPESESPSHANQSLLGGSICIEAELTEKVDKRTAESLVRQLLSGLSQPGPIEVPVVDLNWGFLGIHSDIARDVWVLLVNGTDRARMHAEELLHRVMPPLFLARVKWRLIVDELEDTVIPHAYKLEAELSSVMDQVRTQPRTLTLLEHASDAIPRIQVPFAEILNTCEERLQTLKVNRGNIQRLLQATPLCKKKTRLTELLLSPLQLSSLQLSSDVRYFFLTQTQADRMLRGIQTMSALRSRRLETGLSVLLELFVVLELFHAFPELHQQLTWYSRVALIIVLMLTLYGVVQLYISRKSKSE